MIRVVSKDYSNRKSKYKHYVLGYCVTCRTIQVYKVTDDFKAANNWESLDQCNKCEGICGVCILSKYQKPPGFARKCGKCDFRYTCATTKIEEESVVLVGMITLIYEAEDLIKKEV